MCNGLVILALASHHHFKGGYLLALASRYKGPFIALSFLPGELSCSEGFLEQVSPVHCPILSFGGSNEKQWSTIQRLGQEKSLEYYRISSSSILCWNYDERIHKIFVEPLGDSLVTVESLCNSLVTVSPLCNRLVTVEPLRNDLLTVEPLCK